MKEPRTTAIWVMELDPGYLAARHPEALVKDPLSRKQERSWDYRPDQTFDNVVGLTLALDQEKTSELATELGRKRRESRWCDAPLQGSPALGRARRLFRRGVPRCVGGSQINDMQLWSVLQRAFVITDVTRYHTRPQLGVPGLSQGCVLPPHQGRGWLSVTGRPA